MIKLKPKAVYIYKYNTLEIADFQPQSYSFILSICLSYFSSPFGHTPIRLCVHLSVKLQKYSVHSYFPSETDKISIAINIVNGHAIT